MSYLFHFSYDSFSSITPGVGLVVSDTPDCQGEDMLDCQLEDGAPQCVARSLVCDQMPDCKNGWDESVQMCGQ